MSDLDSDHGKEGGRSGGKQGKDASTLQRVGGSSNGNPWVPNVNNIIFISFLEAFVDPPSIDIITRVSRLFSHFKQSMADSRAKVLRKIKVHVAREFGKYREGEALRHPRNDECVSLTGYCL